MLCSSCKGNEILTVFKDQKNYMFLCKKELKLIHVMVSLETVTQMHQKWKQGATPHPHLLSTVAAVPVPRETVRCLLFFEVCKRMSCFHLWVIFCFSVSWGLSDCEAQPVTDLAYHVNPHWRTIMFLPINLTTKNQEKGSGDCRSLDLQTSVHTTCLHIKNSVLGFVDSVYVYICFYDSLNGQRLYL